MRIGDSYEIRGVVTEKTTAASLGSGSLPVFATPYMGAMMENAAFTLLQRELPEGKTSVGTRLALAHNAPSPVGMSVRVTAEVADVSGDGRIVDFKVAAYDDAGSIGEGMHRRAVVDADRFLAKCRNKLKK